MITVAAALIQQDGRILICQRRRSDRFALKWEFPGGKVRPGETAAEALARELAEELGATAAIGPEIYRTRHRYPEYADEPESGELELIFFSVQLLPGLSSRRPLGGTEPRLPRNLAFEQIEWEEPAALPQYDFLPADRELILLLSSGALRLP